MDRYNAFVTNQHNVLGLFDIALIDLFKDYFTNYGSIPKNNFHLNKVDLFIL